MINIPAERRGPHAEKLADFLSIPTVSVGGKTHITLAGFGGANPRFREFKRLENILKDEKDRWHVFVASRNHIKCVVTVDKKTMLKKTDKVLVDTGVRLVRPSELLALIREGKAIISRRSIQPQPPSVYWSPAFQAM